MGDYIPSAPVNDEAKKANGNLPGMGGVFNVVNLHLYHYAGNNPVKYVDPDGRAIPAVIAVAGAALAAGMLSHTTKELLSPETRQIIPDLIQAATDAVVSGAKTVWGGLQKAGEEMMAVSNALKAAIVLRVSNAGEIGDLKKNPPDHPDYYPPKNWDGNKVKTPTGKGVGWPDKSGNVWQPTDHKGTHNPHWDVQHKDGTHTPVYPPKQEEQNEN